MTESSDLYDRSWASIDPDRSFPNIVILQLKFKTKDAVWIASYNYPYEGGGVIGAYSTKEKGVEGARVWRNDRDSYADLIVCEMQIDN